MQQITWKKNHFCNELTSVFFFFSDSLYLIITIFLGCLLRIEYYGKAEEIQEMFPDCKYTRGRNYGIWSHHALLRRSLKNE